MAIAAGGEALLHIALCPDLTPQELRRRLATPRRKQSLSTFLRKALNLAPPAIGLLHEAAARRGKPVAAMDVGELVGLIEAVPVRLTGIAPLERAISSAGGVSFGAVDEHFMLRRRPGVFVAGEMLDWEAPTGGYLLNGCLALGKACGESAADWLTAQ